MGAATYHWFALLGTMSDVELARRNNVSASLVLLRRQERGILAYESPRPWAAFLGTVSDSELARRFNGSTEVIRRYRVLMGIPSFSKTKKTSQALLKFCTCTKCGDLKPLESFPIELKRGKPHRRADCRKCVSARQGAAKEPKYAEWVAYISKLKDVPCASCQGIFAPHVMDFDHRDPTSKIGEVSRSFGLAWGAAEIQKCDILCACCHRLRTYLARTKSGGGGRKRLILRELKAKPCADCGGSFHYCQMDFDHVRGVKVAPVSRLTEIGRAHV